MTATNGEAKVTHTTASDYRAQLCKLQLKLAKVEAERDQLSERRHEAQCQLELHKWALDIAADDVLKYKPCASVFSAEFRAGHVKSYLAKAKRREATDEYHAKNT